MGCTAQGNAPGSNLEVENNMSKTRKVGFTETVLRDANQSLIATRLPYSKFESILDTIDKAGY